VEKARFEQTGMCSLEIIKLFLVIAVSMEFQNSCTEFLAIWWWTSMLRCSSHWNVNEDVGDGFCNSEDGWTDWTSQVVGANGVNRFDEPLHVLVVSTITHCSYRCTSDALRELRKRFEVGRFDHKRPLSWLLWICRDFIFSFFFGRTHSSIRLRNENEKKREEIGGRGGMFPGLVSWRDETFHAEIGHFLSTLSTHALIWISTKSDSVRVIVAQSMMCLSASFGREQQRHVCDVRTDSFSVVTPQFRRRTPGSNDSNEEDWRGTEPCLRLLWRFFFFNTFESSQTSHDAWNVPWPIGFLNCAILFLDLKQSEPTIFSSTSLQRTNFTLSINNLDESHSVSGFWFTLTSNTQFLANNMLKQWDKNVKHVAHNWGHCVKVDTWSMSMLQHWCVWWQCHMLITVWPTVNLKAPPCHS